MNTSDSSFELIMQELYRQKQHSEKLQEENQEMRRQLTDLRAGHGIAIDILDQRFILDTTSPTSEVTPQISPIRHQPPITIALEDQATSVIEARFADNDRITDAPTVPPPLSTEFSKEMQLDQVASGTTSSSLAVWPGPTKNPSTQGEEEKETLRRELMGSFLLE